MYSNKDLEKLVRNALIVFIISSFLTTVMLAILTYYK